MRSGRALYVGISSYTPEKTKEAAEILRSLGTPLLIHQPRYNLFDRWIEDGLTNVLKEEGVGAIAFSSLAQGVLTNKYLNGIPADSRAARAEQIYLGSKDITPEKIAKVQALNELAQVRGQSLAQMSLAWVLNNDAVTSTIIGASRVEQIADSVKALDNLEFSATELEKIEAILR